MSDEKRIRLNQAARQMNVGVGTIVEFLAKKGHKIDSSPNTVLDADAYALLEKEFGGGKSDARLNVRERIGGVKQETISLDSRKDAPAKRPEEEFKEELVIKTGVISAREEVAARGPKVIGKIDLNPKPKVEPKPEPKPEPPKAEPVEVKPVVQQPVVAAPKKEAAPQKPEPPKAEPVVVKPVVQQPVKVAPEKAVTPEKAEPAKPVMQSQTYDERRAADSSNVFRPGTDTLTGPKVLGKIDMKDIVSGKREKRKRINKVDLSKQQPGAGSGGGQQPRGNKPFGGGGPGGGHNANAGGKKKGGQKGAPKPLFRPEVSDEEVQKQVKDTLARLTSKGSKSKSAKYSRDKRDRAAQARHEEIERAQMQGSTIQATEFVTVSELATMMNVGVNEVIMACMNLGLMVSINQRLDA